MSQAALEAAKFAKLLAQHGLNFGPRSERPAGSEDRDETLTGTNGDDVFRGDSSDDTFNGGRGNDFFVAGSGHETFIGGTGLDTVIYNKATEGVSVDLSTGSALRGAAGDSFSSIENLLGSSFADFIVGDSGNNTLGGLGGGDIILGGDGDDAIFGGDGNDFLYGERGNDTINGGIGNDQFLGLLHGRDVVSGGEGNDDFLFTISAASRNFHLTITDFDPVVHNVGTEITESQAQAKDFIELRFDRALGTDLDALGAATVEFVGDDAVLHLTNSLINGTIVFENVLQHIPTDDMFFSIFTDFAASRPSPV